MQWQRYDSKGEPNLTCRLCPDTNKLLDGSPILRACKILPTIARWSRARSDWTRKENHNHFWNLRKPSRFPFLGQTTIRSILHRIQVRCESKDSYYLCVVHWTMCL